MDKKCETAISECAEHKEPYSLFCDTDKKLCCVDCIYKGQGNHKNHNVIPLKQSFNLLKQELGNFKSKQKDKLHQIDESIRIQTLNRQQILKTFFSYKEIVNKEFQKLIQTIQQRQSVVLDEINSAFSHKLMDAEENLRLLQEIRIEFKNFKELENAQKNGNFLQQVKIYSVKQQLTKSLKSFEGIAIVENTKEEINQFDFQSKHQIMLEINQLGRIKNNSSAKSQTQKQYLQLQQQQQQVSQKQGPSSSYFNTIKHSTSPNNAVRTTLKIDNDPQDKPESDGMEQFTQRNLDLKLSLNAAGIRASLETPSGQNSINSRQIYQSSSQRPKSPQPNNSSHSIQNQTQMQNSHSHGLLLPSQNQHASNQHSQNQPSYSQLSQNPKDNSYNPPLQMDHMNVFAADQQIQQNTVQTERQSCTSHTSKKSFMFNEKPPLQTVKKQYGNQHLKTEGGDSQGGPLHYPNQIQEQDQKLKLNKCYNSSSQQNLFISNDGQFLNSPAQNLPSKINHGPISTQSDSSSQNQVLFQTSGSYSTKKTQYSSNSQNNGKFSSLSAQIKQITQNVPDYFENADYDVIQLGEMDKENAFQEPEEQMTYLNSVSSRKEHIGQPHAQQQQQQKLPSSGANNGNQNQVTPTQIKYEKLGFSQQKKAVQTNTQKEQSQIERFKALNENTGINNSTNNIKGTKIFDDKTYFILNQTQQNTTMNNTTSNSFLMNTSQISNIQADNSKSQTFLNASGKTNQILNSGSLTKRGNVNKFFNNESLENSNEGNKELIKQLNEEILYENFQHHQERDEKNMSLSAQLIESMNLKEKDHEQMTNRNNNNNPNSSNSVKNITEQQGSFQNSGIVPSPFFNESRILDNKSKEQLINILPFKCKSTSLLYSASEDRLSSDLFHEKCDGRGPYLIIVKANSYVFGYYSPISFVKCDKYITCSNSFIFTLNNIYNTAPMIFPVKQDKKFIALYQSVKNPCLGSTLQNKQDLWINFDDPRNSFSCLGYAYKIEGQFDGNKILAGQYTDWNVQGIEIFNASQ